ncbi:hypothetical protein B0T18DRAFT_212834 [Schizothecium vesticola]|uniref:Uncharacterized protein n=1 Tax=Schizothecium vesticola TaxID=314040 RepID=A0AA40JZ77_9PEZI|nr:hypothetical protein B0T18DRAFT_212834 [Schizothecium vesticola]
MPQAFTRKRPGLLRPSRQANDLDASSTDCHFRRLCPPRKSGDQSCSRRCQLTPSPPCGWNPHVHLGPSFPADSSAETLPSSVLLCLKEAWGGQRCAPVMVLDRTCGRPRLFSLREHAMHVGVCTRALDKHVLCISEGRRSGLSCYRFGLGIRCPYFLFKHGKALQICSHPSEFLGILSSALRRIAGCRIPIHMERDRWMTALLTTKL